MQKIKGHVKSATKENILSRRWREEGKIESEKGGEGDEGKMGGRRLLISTLRLFTGH